MRNIVEFSKEIRILDRGSKKQGIFFVVLGLLFQIAFLLGYWSFLDQPGPWGFIWLTIINSDFFPFTFLLFIFGAACILAALKQFGWQEEILISSRLESNIPGVRKTIRFFRWNRPVNIFNDQIISLRLHSVLLDQIGINKLYQIELDYRKSSETLVETIILYKENEDKNYQTPKRLIDKIHAILSLTAEIVISESSIFQIEGKKKEKNSNSKLP